MANRKKRTVYTESQWQKIVKDYESSGLSVERFCRHRAIGYNTFKRWQQKLQDQSTNNTSFYELRRVEDGLDESACPMSIEFKNGITLQIQNNADMAKVAELIKQYHKE